MRPRTARFLAGCIMMITGVTIAVANLWLGASLSGGIDENLPMILMPLCVLLPAIFYHSIKTKLKLIKKSDNKIYDQIYGLEIPFLYGCFIILLLIGIQKFF